MANRSTMNVSLTPELERFVASRVEGGRYLSASEVVREGLRLLEGQERDREAAHAALKAKLERAAGQAERGELVDPGAVLEKIADRKRARGAKSPVRAAS